MNNTIFDFEFDLTFNLGIKCNTLSMSRDAGVRYFSSPFDNIDTVEGLTQTADLLSNRFNQYFSNIQDWHIDNYMGLNVDEVSTKLLWHKDTPEVYYPHFNETWLTGKGLNAAELDRWKKSKALEINPIFDDFKALFIKRQERLVSLLDSGVNILFLRVDERRSLKRTLNSNRQEDFEYFLDKVSSEYKNSKINTLYMYCENTEQPRNFQDKEHLFFVKIPELGLDQERIFVVDYLKKLTIKPRIELMKRGFSDTK